MQTDKKIKTKKWRKKRKKTVEGEEMHFGPGFFNDYFLITPKSFVFKWYFGLCKKKTEIVIFSP